MVFSTLAGLEAKRSVRTTGNPSLMTCMAVWGSWSLPCGPRAGARRARASGGRRAPRPSGRAGSICCACFRSRPPAMLNAHPRTPRFPV